MIQSSLKQIARRAKRFANVLRNRDYYPRLDVRLRHAEFGNDGASWVLATDFLNSETTVYSFGVGEDISFDLALIKQQLLVEYYHWQPGLGIELTSLRKK